MSISKLYDISPVMGKHHTKSFWQSSLWADILENTKQAEIISYDTGDISLLIERRLIWKHTTALYILGVDGEYLQKDILDDIAGRVASPSDLFIQIEPLSAISGSGNKAPFRRFLEPKTAIIPLIDTTEESLMHRFEEKGRYNIRVALRRGLTTHWVSGDAYSHYILPGIDAGTMTNTELFFTLLEATTERNNFGHNSLKYYQYFISTLEKNNAGGLLFAAKDDALHAAGVFVYTKNQGIYYYGASPDAPEIRRDYGTYLLQWEAMRDALRRGCLEYDFLGISSQPGDKLGGVTAFKMRFAPEKVSLPKETVIILKPVTLLLFRILSKIRKFFR